MCSVFFGVACDFSCTPPAAVAGLIMMYYAHSVGPVPVAATHCTDIYSTYEGHIYTPIPGKIWIYPCLCIYRCWLRYKLQCGQHVKVIADMPETKRKRNLSSPAIHQQAAYPIIVPRGTVAADMHRSPGLDRTTPTSFLSGGDPTPWPRSESESQFAETWRQRICWRCEQSIFIGKSLHRVEPITVPI